MKKGGSTTAIIIAVLLILLCMRGCNDYRKEHHEETAGEKELREGWNEFRNGRGGQPV